MIHKAPGRVLDRGLLLLSTRLPVTDRTSLLAHVMIVAAHVRRGNECENEGGNECENEGGNECENEGGNECENEGGNECENEGGNETRERDTSINVQIGCVSGSWRRRREDGRRRRPPAGPALSS
jgi:hypothetical protein